MRCPNCSNRDTKVIDSRLGAEGMEIRRRRSCPECEERFTTFEKLERQFPRVLKKDQSIENFQADKIRRGITRSLEKRKAVASKIEAMVERICNELARQSVEHISSDQIGMMVLNELSGYDDVAYVRFASVYRRFDSIQDFMQELNRLVKPVDE